jgi:putative glutamine amidotransferase
MAVALGGTLYQDLPTQLPGLDHEVRGHGRAYLAHGIRISSRSHLARVLGVDEVKVNSLHHQGVAYVPDTLMAVGWSEDGLVEALEAPDGTYFLSVQCHPEELWSNAEPRFSRLFASFVEAARSRRATLLL